MQKQNRKENHKRNLLVLLAFLFTIHFQLASAENTTYKDLMIEATVPDYIYLQNASHYQYYDRLFKVTNLGKIAGVTDSIDLYANYNISEGSGALISGDTFFLAGLNSFKTAGTGNFNFTQPGNFSICGQIVNSSYPDNNTFNNFACKVTLVQNNFTDEVVLPQQNLTNLTNNVTLPLVNATFDNVTNFTATNFTETNFTINSSWENISLNSTFNDTFANPDNLTNMNLTNLTLPPNLEENLSYIENLSENITDAVNITDGMPDANTSAIVNISETNSTSNYCMANLSVRTEKLFYEDEPIIFYNDVNPKPTNFTIEYWIEDLFGNVLKAKTNTTNTNSKQFTPKLDEKDKVLLIKNKLYAACLNQSLTSEKMVIYLDNDIMINACDVKNTTSSCTDNNEVQIIYLMNNTGCSKPAAKKYSIQSFYTRAKKEEKNISIYSNVKASNESQLYIYRLTLLHNLTINSSKTYGFDVSLMPGDNTFMALLENNRTVADIKQMNYHVPIGDDTTNEFQIVPGTEASAKQKTEIKSGKSNISLATSSNVGMNSKEAGVKMANEVTGQAVYESKSARAYTLTPYILVGLTVLVAVLLIWKKL